MAWDSDQVIMQTFQAFGYTPTEEEIKALRPSFGEGFGEGVAQSAVGQYVNYKRQMDEFEKNDPLNALQTRMNNVIDQNTKSVQGLYGQLQDTLSAAPQLFGDLSPDQIQTYLAPLQTSFQQQLASVQGTIASRGLAASSTENNALSQTNQQFQENVFSTGLDVGMKSQANKASAIQAQINNLFGQTGQAMTISGQAAGQQSSQKLGISELIASLPSFLNSNSAQMAAFNKALNPDTGGFLDTFNKVTGAINQGVNTFSSLLTLGKNVSTPLGGISNSNPSVGTNPTTPSFASTSPGGMNYQPPGLNADGYNEARFASTGSFF